jgi:hypothetical protein
MPGQPPPPREGETPRPLVTPALSPDGFSSPERCGSRPFSHKPRRHPTRAVPHGRTVFLTAAPLPTADPLSRRRSAPTPAPLPTAGPLPTRHLRSAIHCRAVSAPPPRPPLPGRRFPIAALLPPTAVLFPHRGSSPLPPLFRPLTLPYPNPAPPPHRRPAPHCRAGALPPCLTPAHGFPP